ncbi:Regulatory protein OS=Streptomyces alboniger OX=132473 GN=CP975_01000 PE=4 SV=1 [Streptomyces alboniger]
MEAVSELLTLRTDYAAKLDADLELVEKDRERVRAEITALQDQLHILEGNHALLLSMREALSGHSPAACPEPGPGPGGAVATGSAPAASPVSDGVPHSDDGAAIGCDTGVEAPEAGKKAPTLRDLVAGELKRRSDPCSSHDVAAALARAHPGRRIKEPAMRHALEALVEQGRVGRTKRGSRVFYFSAGTGKG